MAAVNNQHEATEEDELDYMSDEVLLQCSAKDVRPSLLYNRVEKRKHEVMKAQLKVNQTKFERDKQMMKSVEDGLKVPISEDNKGFRMLQKMGYKPGSSIGKISNDSSNKGITVPISVELKRGRGGLGREQHILEKEQRIFINQDDYRLRQQKAVSAREVGFDLRKAQSTCRNLDGNSMKEQPIQPWYWPSITENEKKDLFDDEDADTDAVDEPNQCKKQKLEEDEDSHTSTSSDEEEVVEEPEIPNEEKLNIISEYLRSQYSYCIWCATKFNDPTDMENSCPGKTKDDH